jgi:hypothetical protein
VLNVHVVACSLPGVVSHICDDLSSGFARSFVAPFPLVLVVYLEERQIKEPGFLAPFASTPEVSHICGNLSSGFVWSVVPPFFIHL